MDKFVACLIIIIILPFCHCMPKLGPSQVCHFVILSFCHFVILSFCHFAILANASRPLALSGPRLALSRPLPLSPPLSLALSRPLPLSPPLSLSLCRCLLIIRP